MRRSGRNRRTVALTSLRERLIKSSFKLIVMAAQVVSRIAKVVVPRQVPQEAPSLAAAGGVREVVRMLAHSGYGNHSGMLGRTYLCHIEAGLGQLRLSRANRGIQFGFERTNDGIYCRRSRRPRSSQQRPLHGRLGNRATITR